MIICCQFTIRGVTIALLHDGFWFRVKKWNGEGYWVTWSTKQRFGERFGYERPIWQIGKGIKFRVACFFLHRVWG